MRVFIIGEIGINHNGDLEIAKQLIDGAVLAGADAVKFQKRTIETVYTKEDLDRPRESPWGTTNREQKNGLEFEKEEFDAIDAYCKEKGIEWFASAWDLESQKFLQNYDLKFNKVASAMLTHRALLEEIAREGRHTFISSGMSTLNEIHSAVSIFREANCPFELMHCNSAYPTPVEDTNLQMIPVLANLYGANVGYSGHETDIISSTAAVALGATSIERHITLDKTMYGSDQGSSLEIEEFTQLVSQIRHVEVALGDGKKRVTEQEDAAKQKLRRISDLIEVEVISTETTTGAETAVLEAALGNGVGGQIESS